MIEIDVMPKLQTCSWKAIPCQRSNLDLDTVLTCGQSFTWKKTEKGIWSNVIYNQLYSLYQSAEYLWWCTGSHDEPMPDEKILPHLGLNSDSPTPGTLSADAGDRDNSDECGIKVEMGTLVEDRAVSLSEDEKVLRKYLSLDIDLNALYAHWSEVDANFSKIAKSFTGIRMLQQDPNENLFSFICSSNNHISRIGSMVNKLSENFGEKIGTVHGVEFYSFPQPEQLCGSGVEAKLRTLGFGYR